MSLNSNQLCVDDTGEIVRAIVSSDTTEAIHKIIEKTGNTKTKKKSQDSKEDSGDTTKAAG